MEQHPDDTLLNLAAKGTLHQPQVIEQQVTRMLADPKSQALVRNFAGQWLQVRNVQTHQPSPETLFHSMTTCERPSRRK